MNKTSRSNRHITADDIRVEIDESPKMREAHPGIGALFTATLTVRYSYQVSELEWRNNRRTITTEISTAIRQAVLRQIYGDVWAMASIARRYMAQEMNPIGIGADYARHPGLMWLELLREMGRISPQEPKKDFSDYHAHKPPQLADVLIRKTQPQPGQSAKSGTSIITTGV